MLQSLALFWLLYNFRAGVPVASPCFSALNKFNQFNKKQKKI